MCYNTLTVLSLSQTGSATLRDAFTVRDTRRSDSAFPDLTGRIYQLTKGDERAICAKEATLAATDLLHVISRI